MHTSICSFSGHRLIYRIHEETLPTTLEHTIKALINSGVRTFQSGGAFGFDLLAAEHILELRASGCDVILRMLLPCHDQCKGWAKSWKLRFERVLSLADEVIYVSEKYDQFCMHKRNRELVDTADILLCYKMSERGGTAYTVNYAKSVGKNIVNLADLL